MFTAPFHGSITALITPFVNGKVDEKTFQDFVNWQITEGTHGLVPCGTTGECPTLSDAEQIRLFQLCIEAAAGRVPVMAGCGSNDTAHAIYLTQQAEKAGANAALHTAPYYNKPTQEGLYQHYKAIHEATGLPIYLYNVPGRTVVNISGETLQRLAKLPRIAGVKDATSDLSRPPKTRQLCGAGFVQLSGDDATTLAFLAHGGHGSISVLSNIAPALCAELHNLWQAGKVAAAQALNDRLAELADILFVETSPGPVKYAGSLLGLCRNELRLPLVPVGQKTQEMLQNAIEKAGLQKQAYAA